LAFFAVNAIVVAIGEYYKPLTSLREANLSTISNIEYIPSIVYPCNKSNMTTPGADGLVWPS
jgi:hypothetical protein